MPDAGARGGARGGARAGRGAEWWRFDVRSVAATSSLRSVEVMVWSVSFRQVKNY